MPYYVPEDWNRMIAVSQGEANTKPVEMRPFAGTEEEWQARKLESWYGENPPTIGPDTDDWYQRALKMANWRFGEAVREPFGNLANFLIGGPGDPSISYALMAGLPFGKGPKGKIPKVPKVTVPPKAVKLPPGLKRPIESLSTEELQKRVVKASPHKKLYQAELDRRAGKIPEAEVRYPATPAGAEARAKAEGISISEASKLNAEATLKSVTPEPIVPSMVESIDDIDKALNDFGTKIASKEMRGAITSQSELWAIERGIRAENFAKLLDDEIQKGIGAEKAIENSLTAFKGKFPRQLTGLSLPDDVHNAAYNKIIKVISNDVKLTPKQQSFEIAATKKALDNALAGNPVPDIPGIKGGSAKSRLLKIFANNPAIRDIIENPQKAKSTMSGFLRYEPTGKLPPIEQAEQMSLFKGSPSAIPDIPMAQRIAEAKTSADKALAFYRYFESTPIAQNPALKDQQIVTLLLSRGIQPSKFAVSQMEEVIAYRVNQQFSLLPISSRVKVLDIFRKIGVNAYDLLGIPKSLKFAYDVSMPFRQGFLLGVRHPISWAKMWKPYFKAMRSEELALKLDNAIRTDPELLEAMGKMKALDFYTIKPGATWMERPESMASKIAERFVPGVRISNRGAAVSMNSLMANVAKSSYKVMKKMGSSDEEYEAMAYLINEMAGRGTMPKALQGTMGDFLNKLMTSPRYTFSRFEWPVRLFSPSKAVRQETASTLVAVAGLGATILTLAKLSGASVELDPRSPDAFKIKIGGKRIDIWVGYAQIIRLLAQLSTGQRKDTETGKITSVPRSQIIGRYLQSKESPGIGSLVTVLSGKNYVGEKIDMTTLQGLGLWSKETFAPAALEEMLDAYVLEGGGSAAFSGIGTIGVGVSTYESGKVTSSKAKRKGRAGRRR